MIILWKLNNSGERNTSDTLMDADEIPNKESWTFHKALRYVYELPVGSFFFTFFLKSFMVICKIFNVMDIYVLTCRGHIEDIYDLQWSPDGNNLISGSVDNSAIIWDVVKGMCMALTVLMRNFNHLNYEPVSVPM